MKKSKEIELAKYRVNNLDKDHLRYVVARMNGKHELWYWGSWDDSAEAQRVAHEMGAYMIDMEDEDVKAANNEEEVG